jgi:hypothetical protein
VSCNNISVHGDIVSAEMFANQLYVRKEAAQAVHHRLRVSIHHHDFNFWHGKKCFYNVMKKGFARERTVIFTRHALAVVAHGDKGGEFHVPILSYNLYDSCIIKKALREIGGLLELRIIEFNY